MIRRFSLVVLFGLLLTSCSSRLGRDVPECDVPVTNAVIMQIQSVPSASMVPCLNALQAGWDYNHVQPQSGIATFSLDSDRIGEPFIEIRTTEECDVADAVRVRPTEPGTDLYMAVDEQLTVPIVFIPEGPLEETIDATQAIVTDLIGITLNGRKPDVYIDRSEGSTGDKIRAAQRDGAHVVVVGLRDAEEGTVSLLLAGQTIETSERAQTALDMIEDTVEPPAYEGSWFYLFEGGCTEYRFDANGPGSETVAADVDASIGFADAQAVKDLARSAGYEIP